jgi:hypothetical protein
MPFSSITGYNSSGFDNSDDQSAGLTGTYNAGNLLDTSSSGSNSSGTGLFGNLSSGVTSGLGVNTLGNLLSSYLTNQGLGNAMNTIQSGANQAQGTLSNIYGYQQQVQNPYLQSGNQGLQSLTAAMPQLTQQFTNADLNSQLAPNYAFQLQQGQMANQRASNAAGGGLAGNALQGLQNYTQNFAQNAYQNAFNNAQTQNTNIYNKLSGLAGIGQNAANTLTTAGGTYGSNVSSLQSALAQALAQGQVAQAQTNAGALQSVGNTALLGSIMGNSGSSGGSSGSSLGSLGSLASTGSSLLGNIGSGISSAISDIGSLF